MLEFCVCCGQPLDLAVAHRYCSLRCAEDQLRAVGMLLHSTPQLALSVAEWHDLGSSYASDLHTLELLAPRPAVPVGHLVAHG
jgi:hypothetical protein